MQKAMICLSFSLSHKRGLCLPCRAASPYRIGPQWRWFDFSLAPSGTRWFILFARVNSTVPVCWGPKTPQRKVSSKPLGMGTSDPHSSHSLKLQSWWLLRWICRRSYKGYRRPWNPSKIAGIAAHSDFWGDSFHFEDRPLWTQYTPYTSEWLRR